MSRINSSLASIWEGGEPRLILSDASGVLYTDSNDIHHRYADGITRTIRTITDSIPMWIGTNNTTESPMQIANRLLQYGIDVPESSIVSSGMGLRYLERFRRQIDSKPVFTMGYSGSLWYAEWAGGVSVDHPDSAEAIVLAASTGDRSMATIDLIAESLRRRPRPVICINPDRYVQSTGGRYPVMGYYAEILESRGVPVDWVGKPESNFSEIVAHSFHSVAIEMTPSVWFFDDNPRNVAQLTTDLNISGALIMDTGLCAGMSLDDIHQEFGVVPPVRISALSFEELHQ